MFYWKFAGSPEGRSGFGAVCAGMPLSHDDTEEHQRGADEGNY